MGVTIRIEKLLRGLQATCSSAQCTHRDYLQDTGEDREIEDVCHKEHRLGNERGGSEQGSPRSSLLLASADDSEDMVTSCSDSARILFQDEIAKLVKLLGDSRAHIATLETQLQLLAQEKNDQKFQHDQEIKQLEDQVLRLEQQAEVDVAELKQRQTLIEFEMPALEEQLKSLKDVLRDLNVTEPQYAELVAIPEDRRSLRDHILILTYEKMQKFRQEEENLRLERDTSREACIRANDEVQRLEREVQRLLASHSLQKKEMEQEVEAMAARSERLETDLREAIVQVQVLSAKGALYDEVKEELEKCKKAAEEAERQKMIAETTTNTLNEEKQRFLEAIKEKDYTLELLKMDKGYLSKEVKIQEDLVRKLELEKERQQEKIRELKRSKQEAYDRIIIGSQESNSVQEQRFQSELQRVQEQARQDIEKVKGEVTECSNRELQLLREMRDVALVELEKAQTALHDGRTAYEELLIKYNESQRERSDARNEIKMKQFELDRFYVIHEETKVSLTRLKIENEALTEKVKVLTERYHELDREYEKQIQVGSTSTHGFVNEHISSETPPGQEGIWIQKLAAAVTAIVQRQLHKMETKCLDLQKALDIAESINAELVLEIKGGGKRVEAEKAGDEGKICEAESKLQESLAEKVALEAALRETRRERDRVTHTLQKLKDDLRRLLEARGSIENLQKLLAEKGSNVKEEVLKRFSILKNLESCTKCK